MTDENIAVSSNHSDEPETNRDKALRREVVKLTDSRLLELQAMAIAFEGLDYDRGQLHWHWAAAMNELVARRSVETSKSPALSEICERISGTLQHREDGVSVEVIDESASEVFWSALADLFHIRTALKALDQQPSTGESRND